MSNKDPAERSDESDLESQTRLKFGSIYLASQPVSGSESDARPITR
ncbi:predicted protein [Sclerotinia sclerotiorum 1980 UF-70]|uniref:Uncharacterized protein n=1 Tax=Sclerotinia sclerotiorum (strain ATCC 18683 / 1980 / Ss-1) TaxID=665079 RepID=A7E7V3_SCLS1|nr:predicted protein [Sclerotinia sclerotiorum 1980 UF-70]EDN96455.1 predicted protein [Sclerotinia sclerotiorum 1980 UF-70]